MIAEKLDSKNGISARTLAILTEAFHSYLQSLKANAEIYIT
jgi:hypothetical protein